jgi:hypothetical protein
MGADGQLSLSETFWASSPRIQKQYDRISDASLRLNRALRHCASHLDGIDGQHARDIWDSA